MLFTDRLLPIRHATEVLRLVTHTARRQRSLERAARSMPKPVRWEWAAPRLMPLLARPCFDELGAPIVRRRSDLGPAVEFGIDLGGVFLIVDQPVADRWECSGVVVDLEGTTHESLFLDPFVLEDGILTWGGKVQDDADEWTS